MKKIFCTLLALATFLNFPGCFEYDQWFLTKKWFYLEQKPGGPWDKSGDIFGIIVGEDGSIGTSEGRPPNQWTLRTSGTTQNLNAVKFMRPLAHDKQSVDDSGVVYAAGNNATVLRSTDKGHTWVNRSIPSQTFIINGLDVFMQTTTSGIDAMVCGDNGNVWRSTNQGANWLNRSIITTKKITSIACVTFLSTLCAAVGDSGLIYRTLTGGVNWENKSISPSISFKKVVSQRYDRFCAVGTGGAIYTSTDYGNSWIPRSSGTTVTLRDVLFTSPDSGIAVGDNGTVRLTSNGGINWFSDSYISSLTTRNIFAISRVDANTFNSITQFGTEPGDNGADTTFFLAVSSEPFTGIEPISNFIADLFSLKQNYPNPFNPVTNIEISVPEVSFVKLVIYDIQGREVETLVSSELRPGGYKIDWNASLYPSGVYFYTITAGDYRETKKMVLVK